MNPELRALLKQVADKLTEYVAPGTADHEKRRAEVNDVIRTTHHDVLWQPIANVGFAAGRAARDAEVLDLNTKLTAETGKVTSLTTDLTQFREKHKDIAAVQDEAAKKVKAAEDRVATIEAESERKVTAAVQERDLSAFEGKLVAQGMDADYAKSQGILLRERMKYVAGKLTVMQPGSDNLPYTVHGDELLKVLADETIKRAPKTAITSRVDAGGGTGGGGGGGTGGAAFWDGIRKQETDRATAEKERRTSPADAYGGGGGAATR